MTVAVEARFVTACVRAAGVSAAAGAVRDWPRVANLAARHRVTAFVLSAARSAGVAIPPSTLNELEREAFAAQAQTMFLEAELRRVLTVLVQTEARVLVLKGPALAQTLYADPSLRPYADLDLSVRERDQPRVIEILAELGYTEIPFDSELARQAHVGHAHESGSFHRQFSDPSGRCLIELHCDPLQLGLNPVCEDGRWERALPIPGLPGGLMLGAEDQIVQLSVHAHKHGYSRLLWLEDLDRLLRQSASSIDWSLVEDIARREGVKASVWYTLALLEATLGTPVPVAAARLAPRPWTRLLYRVMWPKQRVANLEGFLRRRAVQFHAAESWHGMLPSLLLMGRRTVRIRLMVHTLLHNRYFRRLTIWGSLLPWAALA